jgi:hypothetical protein
MADDYWHCLLLAVSMISGGSGTNVLAVQKYNNPRTQQLRAGHVEQNHR